MVAAKVGRPNSRRETLLQAAAEVFFEQGYAATSIDAIIERAGGSKRTIYNEFGNKEGLFSAIVTESADKLLSALDVEKLEGRDLEEILTAFGLRLMDAYMSDGLIDIYRTVIAEANQFPDLAKSFYEKGPGRAVSRLADVLEAAKRRGEIEVKDPRQLAGLFVGLLRGNLFMQIALGLRPSPSKAEVKQLVASSVAVFLNGVLVRQRKPKPTAMKSAT